MDIEHPVPRCCLCKQPEGWTVVDALPGQDSANLLELDCGHQVHQGCLRLAQRNHPRTVFCGDCYDPFLPPTEMPCYLKDHPEMRIDTEVSVDQTEEMLPEIEGRIEDMQHELDIHEEAREELWHDATNLDGEIRNYIENAEQVPPVAVVVQAFRENGDMMNEQLHDLMITAQAGLEPSQEMINEVKSLLMIIKEDDTLANLEDRPQALHDHILQQRDTAGAMLLRVHNIKGDYQHLADNANALQVIVQDALLALDAIDPAQ